MGKSLIIKGADFSSNRISDLTVWLCDELSQIINDGHLSDANTNASLSDAGYSPNYDFGSKTFNVIRFIAASSGTISICSAASYDASTYSIIDIVTVTQGEIGTIVEKEFNEVTVPSGHILFLSLPTDTATFKCAIGYSSSFGSTYYDRIGRTARVKSGVCLCIDWGYKY